MKTEMIAVVLTFLSLTGCKGQENNEKPIPETDKNLSENIDTARPKESWKVNKQVDENGNVVKYDSIYTWSYTNRTGDSVSVDVDSLMASMNDYFNERMPNLMEKNYAIPFGDNSLMQRDFFSDDFFQRNGAEDSTSVQSILRQMDSLRKQFFNESYPGLIPPASEKDTLSHT